MLYILHLTNKTHGNSELRFGSYASMRGIADGNADRFHTELRPAHQDEIEARITELTATRREVDFDYQNSAFSSGPRYRERLDGIDGELLMLRRHLRPEGVPAGEVA